MWISASLRFLLIHSRRSHAESFDTASIIREACAALSSAAFRSVEFIMGLGLL
jgi:hypothetical protein